MIEKATTGDLEQVYLLGTLYDNNFCNHYHLDNYINNDTFFINVYKEDNSIVGFIIGTKVIDTIEIELIYVKEEYRRRNIAVALFKSLGYQDVVRILLEVSIQNIPAIRLYEKMGFIVINTRKKYYNGVDALVMEKVIK